MSSDVEVRSTSTPEVSYVIQDWFDRESKHQCPEVIVALPKMLNQGLDIRPFAASQLSLLASELAAETSQNSLLLSTYSPRTLSRAGLAITNLTLSSQRTGFGGKTILELQQDSAVGGDTINENGIRVGDIVRVGQQPKGGEKKTERKSIESTGTEGVVVRVGQSIIQVALDKEGEDGDGLNGRLWV